MAYFPVLIRLLGDRTQFLQEVRTQTKLNTKIISLLATSSLCFAAYGAIMGAYSGGWQILASAIKLPALYFITLVVCLPPLYFFDLLFGSKLTFSQYITMGLVTIAIIGGLLVSFAPMMLFFLTSAKNYNFFLLLNVLVMALTGYVGVKIFYRAMRDTIDLPGAKTSGTDTHRINNQSRRQLLGGWVVMYGLIGAQLGWTLSPFVGIEGEPFQFFRSGLESNFYAEVLHAIFSLSLGL